MWVGTHPRNRAISTTRRRVVLAAGSLLALSGCLGDPSSGGPPFDTVEVDDGPVYGPGIQDERELAYFAGLITTPDGSRHLDLDAETHPATARFLAETDFTTQLLGVVQVAGVNSSTHLDVVDLKLTPVNLTVVLALRDDPPHSDDRVITTLLLRVPQRGSQTPERIWVELDVEERHETFSGGRPVAG